MQTITRTANGVTEKFSISQLNPNYQEKRLFENAQSPEDTLVSIATVILTRYQDRLTFYNNSIVGNKIQELATLMRCSYQYVLETYFFWYKEEGIYELIKDEKGHILREDLIFRNPFPGRLNADTSFTFDGVTYAIVDEK